MEFHAYPQVDLEISASYLEKHARRHGPNCTVRGKPTPDLPGEDIPCKGVYAVAVHVGAGYHNPRNEAKHLALADQ